MSNPVIEDMKTRRGCRKSKNELMRRAIQLSSESLERGGGPFGAVIARDGEIVAEGSNGVTLA